MHTSKNPIWLGLAAICLLAFSLVLPAQAQGPRVVISQVYGGGGNSGATYKNDFIELFNAGTVAQDLTGWSVQYTSAAGTAWTTTNSPTVLSGTIQPGQYYLVQEGAGADLTKPALPTPDATGLIALGATAGKVALVSNSTILTGSCPLGGVVIDFVGFGPTATCSETSPTAILSNGTAAIRTNVCVDANNNFTEFSVAAPAPRNSATALNVCSGPPASTKPSGIGLATPASVDIGLTSLLTVSVTPGTLPTSTGITVLTDLSAIGDSATQSFFDDGTNGDAVAGDNIFSYTATIANGTTLGAKSLTATISDTQLRTVTATIAVTVTTPAVAYSIHDIRANSDLLMGYPVQTSGIVTGLRSNGYFLQEKDSDYTFDGTSGAIFVFTSSAPPASAVIGNELTITATLSQYPLLITPTELELIGSVVKNVVGTGNTLPAAIDITPDSSELQSVQFEQYSGMLVKIADTKVTGPTNAGALYVAQATMPRPFREPGIQQGVQWPDNSPENIPVYDGNPEVVRVDMSGCTIKPDLAVGDSAGDLVGPMGYYYSTTYGGAYSLFSCLAGATTTTKTATPVTAPLANEFTVATFNMWNFTASTTQLAKASLEIVNILHMPDVIGVEEVSNLAALQAVAARVNSDAALAGQTNPSYAAAMPTVSGNQNVGFLYRTDHVSNPVISTLADTLPMAAPCGSYTLWDRQPVQMDANITLPGGYPFPVTVMVNHLRSLIDVETIDVAPSVKGQCARIKRGLEAEALAQILSGLQQSGKHLIVVGDLNAFDFSDGYVDVLGALTGNPAPPDQVVVANTDWINPNLSDLITSWPEQVIYTYVENGSAQSLDHIVVNEAMLALPHRVEVAHVNADFPVSFSTIATRPERVSDHDQPIVYFELPTKPALIVSVNNVSKTYGSANPTFTATITGAQNNDTFPLLFTTTADVNSEVGPYTITATIDVPQADLDSYTVTINPGTLTVTPAPFTVKADDVSRLYGAANPTTFTGTITGLQNGDNITATYAATATTISGAGSYAITATLVDTDSKLGNYAVTNTPGTLTINKTELIVAGNDVARTYGAANPAAFTGTITGMQNGDIFTATYSTVATSASGVGAYTILATLFDPGSKLENYEVIDNPGTLNIDPAALTVTTASLSKPYGASNPPFTGSFTGIQNGDNITAIYATAANATSGVGDYPITATLVDPGSKLGNYTVANSGGTLTINKAALTVTVASLSKPYGASNPPFTGSLTGIQNGDNITATYASIANASSGVGVYPITATLVDADGKLGNYATTLVNGTLTITQTTNAVSLGASVNSVIAGSPVTFTATLAGATGSVTFKDVTTTLGTATINGSGVATYTAMLVVGSHSVTAIYAGDANFAASTSNAVAVAVTAFPPPAITSFNQGSAKAGAAAFTLNVYGSNFTATSTVNWNGTARTTTYVSATELHAAILATDLAILGTPSVTVVNTTPSAGTSNGFTFAIDTAAGTSGVVTVTSAPSVTVTHGLSATATFTFTGASADAKATAQCFNMPSGATCTYNDTTKVGTITTAAGTPTGTYPVLVVFTITNTKLTAMQTTGRTILWSFAMLPVGFMLMGTGSRRKRRWLILLALMVVALSLVGCGGSPTSTVRPTPQQVVVQSTVGINLVVN